MSNVTWLHDAVRRGDVEAIKAPLDERGDLANAVSETDARGTYPLHVAAELDQADAARVLLGHGADVSRRDAENFAFGGATTQCAAARSLPPWRAPGMMPQAVALG